MNKELINKYKPEFDHWLNEGRILYKHTNSNAWWNEEPWSYSLSYVTAVIINDEYSEFRKALAEGKTIQVLQQHKDNWIDIDQILLNTDLSRYRIKPDEPKFKIPAYFKELSSGIVVKFTEKISYNCFGIIVESSLQIPQKNKGFEWRCWDIFSRPERWEYLPNYNEPKFKVGDFVRYVRAHAPKALEINNINGARYNFTNSEMSCLEHELESWTPVKDEWCWFYGSKSSKSATSATLAQFKEMYNNYFMSTTDTPWEFCEPFLNSLPSYLKDK